MWIYGWLVHCSLNTFYLSWSQSLLTGLRSPSTPTHTHSLCAFWLVKAEAVPVVTALTDPGVVPSAAPWLCDRRGNLRTSLADHLATNVETIWFEWGKWSRAP